MNKCIPLLLLIFVAVTSHAQDDVYKTIAKETCDCIAKKNYNYSTADKSEIQMSLGLCMLESAQKNKLEIDVSNNESMTALGQKVGLLMAPICPEVFKAFLNNGTEEVVEETEEEYPTLSGKIKSIEEKDFVYVTLKDDAGKEHKMMWFQYFPGSDDFKDDPKKLIGKSVTITYMVIEVFQPKTKVYYNVLVIVGLELR